ncbi:sialic acid-binding Ig-like lectin 10 isoform X1 [Pelobates fuscus]|uniref:sialic acid-binding Ig-like lectin 10 isoform X1 n=1 Tax=Pelobates fuscus TaxID=191477 RepID=UPI002FE4AEC4
MLVRRYCFLHHCPTAGVLLWFLLSTRFTGNKSEANPKYSITATKSVTAQIGLCVHITCSFIIERELTGNAKGLWYREYYRDGKLVASKTGSVHDPGRRFLLTGDVSKGDCSFSISDVEYSDWSSYQFRVEDNDIKFTYFDIRPLVRVAGITDKTAITHSENLLVDKEVTLTCTGLGRCSETSYSMRWDGLENLQSVSSNKQHVTNQNGSTTFYSNITFIPTKENDKSFISCMLIYETKRVSITGGIILDVQYPPYMNISITGGFKPDAKENTSIVLREGKSIVLECKVASNPTSSINWWIGSNKHESSVGAQTRTYSLQNISPKDAAIYLCLAQNNHGNTSKFFNVIVQYPPRTPNISCSIGCSVNAKSIVYAEEGSSFKLFCSAESLPAANLFWIKDRQNTMQTSSNGPLTVNKVSFGDEGTYTCTANNLWGNSSSNITVMMTYGPKSVGDKSSCSMRESLVECTCVIQSFPLTNITWKINMKYYITNISNDSLHIVTVKQSHSISTSNLTLKLTDGKKPLIECMTYNDIGDLVLRLLDNSGDNSFQSSIPGVITGVVIIVLCLVTAALIFTYSRKRKLSEKNGNMKTSIVSNSEAIYCNTNHTPKIVPEEQLEDQDTKTEDDSIYMNCDKEPQYVTLDFSKMPPRIVPEEEEVEYSEVKCTQKHN